MACAPTRAASSSGSPSTSVTAAEAAAVSAPQPEASKPASGDPVALDAQRDPDEVAAGGPAGRPVVPAGDGHAAPRRRAQVLGEALAVHTAESRRVLGYRRRSVSQVVAPMSANLRSRPASEASSAV